MNPDLEIARKAVLKPVVEIGADGGDQPAFNRRFPCHRQRAQPARGDDRQLHPPRQYSSSTVPAALGLADGHQLKVREVRLSAGAGFVVMIYGDIMTMPGLPRHPCAMDIDVDDDGNIRGLS